MKVALGWAHISLEDDKCLLLPGVANGEVAQGGVISGVPGINQRTPIQGPSQF
jgi:hypothetical protein